MAEFCKQQYFVTLNSRKRLYIFFSFEIFHFFNNLNYPFSHNQNCGVLSLLSHFCPCQTLQSLTIPSIILFFQLQNFSHINRKYFIYIRSIFNRISYLKWNTNEGILPVALIGTTITVRFFLFCFVTFSSLVSL